MEIDYDGLKKYLCKLDKYDFRNQNVILEAHSIDDILFFGYKGEAQPEQIVDYGQCFMTDLVGGQLNIVKLTRRKYKTPTGRLVRARLIHTIIENCQKQFGTPINGYWVIPKQFIKY